MAAQTKSAPITIREGTPDFEERIVENKRTLSEGCHLYRQYNRGACGRGCKETDGLRALFLVSLLCRWQAQESEGDRQ
jgi:hypothetical protein